MAAFLDLFNPNWEDGGNNFEEKLHCQKLMDNSNKGQQATCECSYDCSGNESNLFDVVNDNKNILKNKSKCIDNTNLDSNFNFTNSNSCKFQYFPVSEGANSCKNYSDSCTSLIPDQLPSEPQEGNIEYKLKLINPNKERFKRLVSQMQWRLREGLGEAIYEIGVEDCGRLQGLNPTELEASMKTLKQMANQLGASLTVIREKKMKNKAGVIRKVKEILVRKVPDDQYSIEIRIAVLGSSNVGKSTMLGVLTRGELDNGRGCARLNVFRHPHEIYSGKTSSISLQMMGFDSEGHVIDQTCSRSRDYDFEDICKKSSKIINFIDLAGDQKYLRTTVFGLSGYSPHYAVVVVSVFTGVTRMTREHISLAFAFAVPIVIVVNKIDMAQADVVEKTMQQLRAFITQPSHRKVPFLIRSEDDAITAGSVIRADHTAVPIFLISSVSGQGLHLLKKFLFVLPPKITSKERESLEQEPAEFHIDEVFDVERNCVLGGLLCKGVIVNGSTLLCGPYGDYSFKCVKVLSIYRNKVPCRVVYAGQSASLSVTPCSDSDQLENSFHIGDQSGSPIHVVDQSGSLFHNNMDTCPVSIRKGMKLLHESVEPKACLFFQARLCLLEPESYICVGSQTNIHMGNIRQNAVIVAILGRSWIRTNEQGSVVLKFVRHPEYVTKRTKFVFCSNGTKGTGLVIQVFHEECKKNAIYQ